MKKVLLFVVLACMSLVANAQTKCSLYIDTYPYNYTAAIHGAIDIDFTSQWGEFKLSVDNTVDVSEYVGCNVVVSDVTYTPDGEEGPYVQLLVKYNDGSEHYGRLQEGDNEYTFSTDAGNITTFELQGGAADAYVKVTEAYLIKADGTTEPMVYGGASWGCSFQAYDPATITYTGQYGGVYITDAETDEPITYTYGSDEDLVITIKLAEALPVTTMVELDDANGGFAYPEIAAGETEYTLTINDEICTTYEYDADGNVVEGSAATHDVAKIYIKANAGSGYPYTVAFESITATYGEEETEEPGDVETGDYFVNLDFEEGDTGWTLYEGDNIGVVSTTDGPSDANGDYYFLVNYGYNFPASTVVISQESATELPAGTYTISARICVGDNGCTGNIELYAASGETDVYTVLYLDNDNLWESGYISSVELTLNEAAKAEIGIRTNSGYSTSGWLWLYADDFKVEAASGDATGITDVEVQAPATNGALYNIAGQRVSEGTKGLLIKNGKKVLVK